RGIAHSERAPDAARRTVRRIAGFQTWVALPKPHEEAAPSFVHRRKDELPLIEGEGASVHLAVGSLYGERAAVPTFSEMFFADVPLSAGARLPVDAEHEERGAFLVEGEIEIASEPYQAGRLIVFRPGEAVAITARTA